MKLLYFRKEKRVKREEKKKVHHRHTIYTSLICAPPLLRSRCTSPNAAAKGWCLTVRKTQTPSTCWRLCCM